jgi:bifunctional DNA-binding transcriptional regulator/antitoxin component of YhaV-PrlF toxin-antitoxin module
MEKVESSRFFLAGITRLQLRGGSLQATIPAMVVKRLGLGESDKVAFFIDNKHKFALIVNAKYAEVITAFGSGSLAFSISKELSEKLRHTDA